jgi:Holliday junction DNA helicase RuvB
MSNLIRPTTFDTIIGQKRVVDRLRIVAGGCLKEGSVMPHLLIDGPPGLGKTTLAGAVANALDLNLYTANAANIRSIKHIIPYLTNIAGNCVLFIDEIHRLPKLVEEFLYPVMEDYRMDIIVDGKPKSTDIPMFTLIGATTSGGSLSQPLYDRFMMKEHLTFYDIDDLAKLARSNAEKLGLNLSDDEIIQVAKRSKGTPRILNSRIMWLNSYIKFNSGKTVSINEAFADQGIDENGLDVYDKLYMDALRRSKGTPLGIASISSSTGIDMTTIEKNIEPYLLRNGYVIRTPKGRILNV